MRGCGQLDESGAVHAQQRDLATHGLGSSRSIEPAELLADTACEMFAAEGVLREPGADDRQLLLGKIAPAKTQGILRGIAFHGAGPWGWPPCGRSRAVTGSGGKKFHGSQRVISSGAFEP